MDAGRLWVVSTPIGDLRDLSDRARQVLGTVGLVAAEDTRVTRKLYGALDLAPPKLVSCHDHNEGHRASTIVDWLQRGEDVALVSDAGTPLVSDPGYRVVQAVLEAGIEVVPVPGPSAPIAALSVSGLPTDRFLFAGFPPRQAGKRRAFFTALEREPGTVLLFEAPHRIVATLEAASEVLGDRRCCLAISLTKEWERFHRGSLSSVHARLTADPDEVIGEMTLAIEGASAELEDPRGWAVVDALAAAGVSPSVIRDAVAEPLGLKRRMVYQRALKGED